MERRGSGAQSEILSKRGIGAHLNKYPMNGLKSAFKVSFFLQNQYSGGSSM